MKERRKTPKQWETGYLPKPLTSSDQNQTLHGGWPSVCSYACQVWYKSVKGLRRCGGSKMALPYYFGQWLIQQLVLPYIYRPWFVYFWSRVSDVITVRRPCCIEYCDCVCVSCMLIFMFAHLLAKYMNMNIGIIWIICENPLIWLSLSYAN